MKKLLKQLLAVTTAIMMAITLLPAMANAEATINPNDTNTGTLTLTKKVPKKMRMIKMKYRTQLKVQCLRHIK